MNIVLIFCWSQLLCLLAFGADSSLLKPRVDLGSILQFAQVVVEEVQLCSLDVVLWVNMHLQLEVQSRNSEQTRLGRPDIDRSVIDA